MKIIDICIPVTAFPSFSLFCFCVEIWSLTKVQGWFSCFKPVEKSHKSTECDRYSLQRHIGCEGISNEEYKKLIRKDSFLFYLYSVPFKRVVFPIGYYYL